MDYSNKWDHLDDLDDEDLPGLSNSQLKEVDHVERRLKCQQQEYAVSAVFRRSSSHCTTTVAGPYHSFLIEP